MKVLQEICFIFFKLGCLAFGGPVAHISMMEYELITKRGWMDHEHFMDLVGATNLIPGPNSTQMAMHCGMHRAGWPGLFVAGFSFIIPAAVITVIFGWFYHNFGSLDYVEVFLWGIRPAVLAIIVGAVFKLGQKALKTRVQMVIALLTFFLYILGLHEILCIICGGIMGLCWMAFQEHSSHHSAPAVLGWGAAFQSLSWSKPAFFLGLFSQAGASEVTLFKIFELFLTIGLFLFGGGYVLIAFLEGEAVNQLGWLTQAQLLDAVAIGQMTPGPILTTATLIGYQLKGVAGAFWATLGIFLPSFFLVGLLQPVIIQMKQANWSRYLLDSVNAAVMAIMVVAVLQIAKGTLVDWRFALIAAAATTLVLVFKKVSFVWVILLGMIFGAVLRLIPV